MVFPADTKQLPRHPSQLYEFALEGLVLALILWSLREVPMPPGTLFWIFIACYGLFRTFGELFREPDAHLSFILPNITAGMIISLPMLVIGTAMVIRRLKSGEAPNRADS
jgi:phosphatidylglycerol:prolipoprotein diacylglycerol transferase